MENDEAIAKLLDQLPDRAPGRLALKVKPSVEPIVRRGHPWLFESAIARQKGEGRAGDLAILFDRKKNQFLAAGLFDPHSPIRVKLLQFNTPAAIDGAWFEGRIAQAYERRRPLFETDTDSYRLVFGENDGLPGLVADVYAHVLVVKLYSLIWLPYLRLVLPALLRAGACTALVLRLSRQLQRRPDDLAGLYDGQVLCGELPDPEVVFREHGLRFIADVVHGHKTGFFLDHRHNRRRVGELAAGRRVLDVFAYAGGFSVHALAGGAAEVVSLDISEPALAMARRNAALNFPKSNHRTLAVDAFAGLEQLRGAGETFDLLIVDPPAFAKSDKERAAALQSYARLVRLAAPLVRPGGLLLLASCSSRVSADEFFDLVQKELSATGRPFRELERTFHDIDHPIGFAEGAYLKAGYYGL